MGDHPMPEIEISVIGNYEVDSGIVTVTYNGRISRRIYRPATAERNTRRPRGQIFKPSVIEV
jgi:hypothetical protein